MYAFSNNDTSRSISNSSFINNDDNYHPNSTSLFYSPSPYIYEDDFIFFQHFHDLLLQNQHSTTNDQNIVTDQPEPTIEMVADTNNNNGEYNYCDEKFHKGAEPILRKRTSKKDRHSKINTANGPRDRRMRLSLDVARKFFGLQDMLKYDKASKTVEWLMMKSKAAIKELARGFPEMKNSCSTSTVGANSTASSTSDQCEISGVVDHDYSTVITYKVKPALNKDQKKTRGIRTSFFHPVAKESREKARARARERTREKTRLGESKLCVEAMSHELNHLGSSWNSLETGEESGTQGHNKNPFYNKLLLAHELEERAGSDQNQMQQLVGGASEYIVGDSMVITDNWSPSSTFGYQCNSGILNENQFSEFQLGKSWEAYDNINLC